MPNLPRRHFLNAALALATAPLASRPARAEEAASDWSAAGRTAIRLLGGGAREGGLLAGLEIRLAPGFKTYWRSPGDSGVPPVFDWSASQNLGGVTVRWPRPVRFGDGAGSSVGYVADVVFPLHVAAADPTRPVKLALRLDYAVCEKMCIPARGEVELLLPAGETAHGERIRAAEAICPAKVETGPASDRFALRAVSAVSEDGGRAARLELTAPPGAAIEDVFVEGPDMWLFGPARLDRADGDVWTALVPLEHRPKRATGPHPFAATIVGGAPPVEIAFDLDFGASAP